MEGFIEIFTNVWEQGFFGVGITEIIVSMLIFIAGAISRAFFVGRVLKWLESLTANTDSEIDDVLLESLKKPLGYIPMTVALYFITVYLPLTGVANTFATNLVKAMIAFTIFSALANSIAPIFQAEDGIRDSVASRGLGDVYKRQSMQYSSFHDSNPPMLAEKSDESISTMFSYNFN